MENAALFRSFAELARRSAFAPQVFVWAFHSLSDLAREKAEGARQVLIVFHHLRHALD